ncbi:MAG: HEPN domain-containing protein [Candidatus Latescibacteria bacterium]|nr:HEPN domain-containing protein [Candidatus Latescibacterota bacterium]
MDKVQQEHIAGYLAKARAKLRVARELVKQHEWDDVVSRAYYAAFHAAQAVLLAEGHQAETHRGLLTLFSLVLVKTGKFEKKWGKFLANLKDDREAGDYEALSYLDEQTAGRALAEAEEFVEKVEDFLGQRSK